ncbi:MAG: DIP1984 family protein [Firmicutes bacterium]|nr:DIP1984 family protein [Bacillota bacterium]
MKLAEALILRADLKKRIAQVETRMAANVKVQEGDDPAEDVNVLMTEYERLMAQLEELVVRINKTNHAIGFEDGTIADAIAQRDALKAKIRVFRNLHEEASVTYDRYSTKEIRLVRCLDVKELQKKIDALAKTYRELDTKMQGLNWTVDLL